MIFTQTCSLSLTCGVSTGTQLIPSRTAIRTPPPWNDRSRRKQFEANFSGTISWLDTLCMTLVSEIIMTSGLRKSQAASSVASLLCIPFAFTISVRILFPLSAIVDIEGWEEAREVDRLERMDNTSLNLVDWRRGARTTRFTLVWQGVLWILGVKTGSIDCTDLSSAANEFLVSRNHSWKNVVETFIDSHFGQYHDTVEFQTWLVIPHFTLITCYCWVQPTASSQCPQGQTDSLAWCTMQGSITGPGLLSTSPEASNRANVMSFLWFDHLTLLTFMLHNTVFKVVSNFTGFIS